MLFSLERAEEKDSLQAAKLAAGERRAETRPRNEQLLLRRNVSSIRDRRLSTELERIAYVLLVARCLAHPDAR